MTDDKSEAAGLAGAGILEDQKPEPSTTPELSLCTRILPESALSSLAVLRDLRGHTFLQVDGRSTVYRLSSPQARLIVQRRAAEAGHRLQRRELHGVLEDMTAFAEAWAPQREVWLRTAPISGGIEIDLGDELDTRVRVTAGGVEVCSAGSAPLFYRTAISRPLILPATTGNFGLVDQYLNLSFPEQGLWKEWVTYTIAHPRIETSVYIILMLCGPQGSAKSTLGQFTKLAVDPSGVMLQSLPRTELDLAIATQQEFLCCFDNCRAIPQWMSDRLCLTSTSGMITGRRLYSDDAQAAVGLHGAVLMTGLQPLAAEPDLADRVLQLHCLPIESGQRRDPAELMQQFRSDLPQIYRGALDRVAEILAILPRVTPVNPGRVYAFSHWLAAAEQLDGAPVGGYQRWYAESVAQAMFDAVHEDCLAAAVLEFAEDLRAAPWTGTPAELLAALERRVGNRTSRWHAWPRNPIAMAKRLRAQQVALHRLNVDLQFGRGRERRITITHLGSTTHD